jgi:hypothetical protein
MNQTTNLSTLIEGMISGAITGVTSARKFYFRTILLVTIIVAGASFTIGMMFRDYLPDKSAPVVQGAPIAPEPTRNRQSKDPPSKRDDVEELQRLVRPNPM